MSSSQVSDAALSAGGGHCNEPIDPSAASADDGPDVEFMGLCFVNVKHALAGGCSIKT